MENQDLRYPIGPFKVPLRVSADDRIRFIDQIEILPDQLKDAVHGLSDEQLDTAYRPEGWTLRQVVHHVADSHTNSYIRFKWALTEADPIIKAYNEKDWALMDDAMKAPVQVSLNMVRGLHQRWVCLLKAMSDQDWSRTFVHPETNKKIPLYFNLALYAWHGNHHLAHITTTKARYGW